MIRDKPPPDLGYASAEVAKYCYVWPLRTNRIMRIDCTPFVHSNVSLLFPTALKPAVLTLLISEPLTTDDHFFHENI